MAKVLGAADISEGSPDSPYREADIIKTIALDSSTVAVLLSTALLPTLAATANQQHQLLSHPSVRAIKYLEPSTDSYRVIDIETGEEPLNRVTYNTCLLAKAKAVISRRSKKYREVLPQAEHAQMVVCSQDLIEIELLLPGPNRVVYKFYSHFYYDNKAFYTGELVATKPQAVAKITGYFKKIEVTLQAKTILFRSDMEPTIGKDAGKAAAKLGLTILPTAAETPAQNSASKVAGREIVTKARTLRIDSYLLKKLQLQLLDSAMYLLNRTPIAKLQQITPFKRVTTKKLFLAYLYPIGCKAYTLRRDITRRDKIEARAYIGYLIGYCLTNIFWIWIPVLDKVVRTRDIMFKDSERYNPLDIDGQTLGELVLAAIYQTIIESISMPEELQDNMDNLYLADSMPVFAVQPQGGEQQGGNKPDNAYPTLLETPAKDREVENIEVENMEVENKLASAAAISLQAYNPPIVQEPYQDTSSLLLPANWKELQRHQHRQQFTQATMEEFEKLRAKGTYRVVYSYAGYKVPLKQVFTYKTDLTTGEVTRFKARLCIRGDLQLLSTHKTYVATLGYKVFRAITVFAYAKNLQTRQQDVVNTFPNAVIPYTVYCLLPEGIDQLGLSNNACLLLQKALYRLAELLRLWYDLFIIRIEDYRFELALGIECLIVNQALQLILIFYVDNIRLIYKDSEQANLFYNYLTSNFEVTQKLTNFFLGIEIEESEQGLSISQTAYLTRIRIKFNAYKRARFPDILLPATKLVPAEDIARPEFTKAYQIRVGSIGYTAVLARPNMAKAYTTLLQFLQNPSKQYIEAADYLIVYLYRTRHLKIWFHKDKLQKELYIDTSFGDYPDRKSSQGFLMIMYRAVVDWQANKQKTVTKSTAEAKLLALSAIASSGYQWSRLLSEIKKVFLLEAVNTASAEPTKVYCDNQRAVDIANNRQGSLYTALRYVDIYQHWIRQETIAGRLEVEWIPTAQQRANGFTKNLPKQPFYTFRASLGIR